MYLLFTVLVSPYVCMCICLQVCAHAMLHVDAYYICSFHAASSLLLLGQLLQGFSQAWHGGAFQSTGACPGIGAPLCGAPFPHRHTIQTVWWSGCPETCIRCPQRPPPGRFGQGLRIQEPPLKCPASGETSTAPVPGAGTEFQTAWLLETTGKTNQPTLTPASQPNWTLA